MDSDSDLDYEDIPYQLVEDDDDLNDYYDSLPGLFNDPDYLENDPYAYANVVPRMFRGSSSNLQYDPDSYVNVVPGMFRGSSDNTQYDTDDYLDAFPGIFRDSSENLPLVPRPKLAPPRRQQGRRQPRSCKVCLATENEVELIDNICVCVGAMSVCLECLNRTILCRDETAPQAMGWPICPDCRYPYHYLGYELGQMPMSFMDYLAMEHYSRSTIGIVVTIPSAMVVFLTGLYISFFFVDNSDMSAAGRALVHGLYFFFMFFILAFFCIYGNEILKHHQRYRRRPVTEIIAVHPPSIPGKRDCATGPNIYYPIMAKGECSMQRPTLLAHSLQMERERELPIVPQQRPAQRPPQGSHQRPAQSSQQRPVEGSQQRPGIEPPQILDVVIPIEADDVVINIPEDEEETHL